MNPIQKTLEAQQVISTKEIQLLQQKLKNEHQHMTEAQRAQLFAKNLMHRLDEILSPFELEVKKHIKMNVLPHTIHKQSFCITTWDVTQAYFELEDSQKDTLDHFALWINQYQTVPFTVEELSLWPQLFSEATLSQNTKALSVMTPNLKTFKRSWFHKQRLDSLFAQIGCCSKWVRLCFILSLSAFIGVFLFISISLCTQKQYVSAFKKTQNAVLELPISLDLPIGINYLEPELQYTEVDTAKLKAWLVTKNSMLSKEPYFTAILNAGKEFNVNPLLLFAITGQEQGFVPMDHKSASKIANNPFNVYGSWQVYQTDIYHSSRIAAQTLTHLSKGCPEDYDQIKWINKSYAENQEWHLGVSYFFDTLTEVAGLQNLPQD